VGAARAGGVAGLLIVAAAVGAAVMTTPGQAGGEARPGAAAVTQSSEGGSPRVTAVEGPSWLRHLGLVASETRLGRMGGGEPPPASRRREPEPGEYGGGKASALRAIMDRFLSVFRSDRGAASAVLGDTFTLAGADLYRLNCQSCHGPDGGGAPPEIKSLIDPVRGTSAAVIEKRMKDTGHPIREAMAQQLASQAEAAILDRLTNGGQKMPPFPHLRGDEVEALMGYLRVLAGVPAGPQGTLLVPQSAARVGEHVVKGTCHICHDATGPGGGHMAMMQGTIPSLASFPRELSLSSVQRQVQYGSSGMMMMMGGQTMPAMPFLTEEEVAAAYFYLEQYPPRP
jgi:mono/diheme cytochrome c family protein